MIDEIFLWIAFDIFFLNFFTIKDDKAYFIAVARFIELKLMFRRVETLNFYCQGKLIN